MLILSSFLLMILVSQGSYQYKYRRSSEASKPCRKIYPSSNDTSKLVCECSKDYCDNLVFDWPAKNELLTMISSKEGQRFNISYNKLDCLHVTGGVLKNDNMLSCLLNEGHATDYSLYLVLYKQYQEVLGFGGAFTDASLINMESLSDKFKDSIILNYYGETGLQYNMVRLPIAGTDFSTHPYSYDDYEEQDLELSHWKLTDEDHRYKIPYLKKAVKLLKERTQEELKIFASSWSPPPWMKTNDNFTRGFIKGNSSQSGTFYKSYAQYLLKFLEAYEAQGIRLWGMTLQNEPGAAYLPVYFFNSLQFSAVDQINFIKYHLGPLLWKNGYTKDKFKLIIGDDSVGFANHQVDKIMKSKEARRYVSGIGVHWYLNGRLTSTLISSLYGKHKDHIEFIISTEACTGSMPQEQKVVLGDWDRGVQYFQDIIRTLNRNYNGWIDWNLALDMQGGPNWSKNFVDAPIIVDSKNQRIYKNPMFYVLGHFSRFLPPGSRRIYHRLNDRSGGGKNKHKLDIATFLTPSDHLVIIIMNVSKEPCSITIQATNVTRFSLIAAGESVISLAYGLESKLV